MTIRNTEAERYLVGCVLHHRSALVYTMSKVPAKFFSHEAYRAMYAAICAIEERNELPELPVVMEQLKRQGGLDIVGGQEGLDDYYSNWVPSGSADRNIDIITRAHYQQKLIDAMRTSLSSLQSQPAGSVDELQTHIAVLDEELRRDSTENSEMVDYRDCDTESTEQRGLLTGYEELDNHIDIRPGMVVAVYGDSGHKKTTFAMNMISRWAKTEKIAVYNYEQGSHEIAKMVNEADPQSDIPRGNLWISPNPPPLEILPLQAKAIKVRKGLDGIVVDYLQTVTTTNSKLADDENNFVRCAMRTLRDLARSQNIWVMVVAQMRKAQGDTQEHQLNPAIDRMRGSGEIKMASSIILSTVLPSKLEQDLYNGEATRNMLVVRIKKNRDCLTGDPGEERSFKLYHRLDSRLIREWTSDDGLPDNRLPTTKGRR